MRNFFILLFFILCSHLKGQVNKTEWAQWFFTDIDLLSDTLINNAKLPGELVYLPHKLSRPNASLWYWRDLAPGPGYSLRLRADDGCRVYVQGQMVPVVDGNVFIIPPLDKPTKLIVHVMNNAMSGGLIKVDLAPAGFSEFSTECYTKELQINYPDFYPIPYILTEGDTAVFKFITNNSVKPVLHFSYDSLNWHNAEIQLPGKDLVTFRIPFSGRQIYYRSEGVKVHKLSLPPEAGEWSFAVWGDPQGGWETFSKIAKQIGADRQIQLSIGLGDQVANGSDSCSWLNFLHILSATHTHQLVALIAGNHDYDGYYNDLRSLNFEKYIRNEMYAAWSFGDCFFVSLDPNKNFPLAIDAAHEKWLLDQLNSAAYRQARWHFLLIHQPPFSQGWPGYRGDEFIAGLLQKYAELYKIDFVLSGHTHDYERLTMHYGAQQVNCIISGGAGGGIEPAENSPVPVMDKIIKQHHYLVFNYRTGDLVMQVKSPEGTVLEEILFKK